MLVERGTGKPDSIARAMETTDSALSPESLLSSAGFVRNLARSLLRDPHSADDVAQEALLTAMQKPPRSERGLRGWLASVVRSVARDRARSEGRRKWREASAARAEGTLSAAEILEREALRAEVVRAVLGLSEPSRSAVLLRYYEDKAPREIARLQGVPVETVRTRIKRGLAELRRALDARLGEERDGWARALLPLAMASARGSAGILPMSVGLQVAASAGLLLLGAGGWRLLGGRAEPEPVAGEGAAVLPAVSTTLALVEQRASVPAREPVPASVPVNEHELAGRVSDPRDEPLAGAILYVSPDGPPPERFRYHPEWIANLRQRGLRF
jgi:RNA polymerase sigma-70 factor (ECF subfamily)